MQNIEAIPKQKIIGTPRNKKIIKLKTKIEIKELLLYNYTFFEISQIFNIEYKIIIIAEKVKERETQLIGIFKIGLN